MILQPSQARVCSGSHSLETSSRGAQLESDIAQLKDALRPRQQIGLTTDLLAQGFAITPERALPARCLQVRRGKTVALLTHD